MSGPRCDWKGVLRSVAPRCYVAASLTSASDVPSRDHDGHLATILRSCFDDRDARVGVVTKTLEPERRVR